MATKMRQSMAEFERAFADEIHVDRVRRETERRKTALRNRQRKIDQIHKHGTARYIALLVALTATVVGVTFGMFQLLLLVMG